MIVIAPAARRVSQLVPKLGTGTDAEIAEVARKISAELEEHGLDLLDLAAFIRSFATPDGTLVAERLVFECLPYAQFAGPNEAFLLMLAGRTWLGPLRLSPAEWKILRDTKALVDHRCANV